MPNATTPNRRAIKPSNAARRVPKSPSNIAFLVTPAERQRIAAAAESDSRPLGSWCRLKSLEAATEAENQRQAAMAASYENRGDSAAKLMKEDSP